MEIYIYRTHQTDASGDRAQYKTGNLMYGIDAFQLSMDRHRVAAHFVLVSLVVINVFAQVSFIIFVDQLTHAKLPSSTLQQLFEYFRAVYYYYKNKLYC